jgi:peroxiredoxin (alkyl hydroperoxide reductase subunit C)
MDFTLVCPSEILEFARLEPAFRSSGARVLGASVDSAYAHRVWRERDPDMCALPFPMLADPRRELSGALGVVDRRTGVTMRATFIVDPVHTIRWALVHDLECGRNVPEVLRVLRALLTERPTPSNWQPGDATLFA